MLGMSERYRQLIAAWKQADSAAIQAERDLAIRSEAGLAKAGPFPREGERAAVARLRAEASERLAAAIDYLSKQ